MTVHISLALLGFSLLFSALFAHGATNNIAVGSSAAKLELPTNIKASVTLTGFSDLRESTDVDHSAGSSMNLSLSIPINKSLSTSLSSSVSRDLSKTEDTKLTNSKLSMTYKKMTATPTVSVTLPTSESDRLENSFRGDIGISGAISKDMDVIKKSISTSYGLSIKKKFHEFSQSSAGNFNTEWILSQSIGLDTEIASKLNIGISGAYIMARTYHKVITDQYEISETISYTPTKKLSVALSHSNGGDPLSYSGRDRNIKFFDETSSTISGSITYSF